MKKYLLVGLVLFSNYAFALLEDEEARKKINEMQGQLNNIEKSLEKFIFVPFGKSLAHSRTFTFKDSVRTKASALCFLLTRRFIDVSPFDL